MTIKSFLSTCLSFTLIALLLVACSSGDPSATPAPTTAVPSAAAATEAATPGAAGTAEPTATPTDAEPGAAGPVGGPGTFNLPQPGIQLDLLSRYQAELTVQFNGTQDGQPIERNTHLTLLTTGPGAQVTRLETSATGEEPIFLLAGEVAGTRFIQSVSDAGAETNGVEGLSTTYNPCSSIVDSEDTEVFTFGDPWRELPPIYGAELAGEETVNDFETEHYTFDQRAIRWASGTTAQGDIWIAKASTRSAGGGFLVRYRLTMQAPAGVLSAASGEQTWQFDLTPLAEDVALLPEGCAPVLTDFPLLPDATAALRLPGYLRYLTGSDLAAASEFYRQELGAADWQEQDAFNTNAERTILLFVRPIMEGEVVTAQEVATITLSAAPEGLKVEVHTLSADVPPPAATEQ